MSTDLPPHQTVPHHGVPEPEDEHDDPRVLLEKEMFWRDHQKWLEGKGYMLRPRFRPEWVPSWGPGDDYFDFEYGLWAMVRKPSSPTDSFDKIITRTLTFWMLPGLLVMLKRIDRNIHPHEVEVGLYFSSEPLASHPRNHCVPIYEVLDIPNMENEVLLVMPLLREYGDPRIKSIGEAVEFFRQVFEVKLG